VKLYTEEHGNGHPLLLLTGLGYAIWSWQRQLPDWSQQFRCVAVDFLVGRAYDRVLALLARYGGLLASLRGEHEDAESEFARLLDLQERAPSPYERARTLMALATARRRHRRRGLARRALEEAVELFERAGAVVWADRARADIATLGLRRGQADELTPMEDRVARAVADGATNREAAAALFLSQRTIEFHLRNVYRKLDLRSRTELAAVLSRATTPTAV
jgi:DNA-binding CsgD family transcriptional regulator